MFEIVTLVELGNISGNFTISLGFLFLNPLTALVQHVLHDVDALNCFDIVFKLLLGEVKSDHVVLLQLLAVLVCILHLLDGVVVLKFFLCLWLALHSEENHLSLTLAIDFLTRKDSSNAALDDLSGKSFFLLRGNFWKFTFSDLTLVLI